MCRVMPPECTVKLVARQLDRRKLSEIVGLCVVERNLPSVKRLINAASFWALSACSHPPMPPAMRMTAATAAKAQRVIRSELAMRACASAVRAWAAFISATCALSRSRASSFLARR